MKKDADCFDCVRRALDDAGADSISLWLRDDDAIAASAALETFKAQCQGGGASPLLAVIPGRLTDSLVADADHATHGWPADWKVGVHGWRHDNRAGPDAKKSEFPGSVRHATTADELERGLSVLRASFGDRAMAVFVPPWNRIGTGAASALPGAGFKALSTFAMAHVNTPPSGVRVLNTHVDIIDWRGGRVGKPADVIADDLAAAIRAGGDPIGVLTHHLVHDAGAIATLDALFAFVATEPRLDWQAPEDVFRTENGCRC